MLGMKALITRLDAVGEPDIDSVSIKLAKEVWAGFRSSNGFSHTTPPLLTPPSANLKLSKGEVTNYGLSLSPHRLSGVVNMCPWATDGCIELCINVSGNGYYPKIQASRILKTQFLIAHTSEFLTLLKSEVLSARDEVAAEGGKLGVRLNVFSDVPWEQGIPWIFAMDRNIQFYDYTKNFKRSNLPSNYHLTYSASEKSSDAAISGLLSSGQNVAIVADKLNGEAPTKWNTFPVIDGDTTDFRPNDPNGVVVLLKPKGRARSAAKVPRGGFIRTVEGFS